MPKKLSDNTTNALGLRVENQGSDQQKLEAIALRKERRKYGGGMRVCKQCGKMFERQRYDKKRQFCDAVCSGKYYILLRPRKYQFSYRPAEYSAWKGMHRRCYKTTFRYFKYYGGRGIKVCERWNQFEAFVADMGPSWKPGLTLDRKDNDGDYTPDNCRWATRMEQQRNKRKNYIVSYGGESIPLAEWSDRSGLNYYTIRSRITRGWKLSMALKKPTNRKNVSSNRK